MWRAPENRNIEKGECAVGICPYVAAPPQVCPRSTFDYPVKVPVIFLLIPVNLMPQWRFQKNSRPRPRSTEEIQKSEEEPVLKTSLLAPKTRP